MTVGIVNYLSQRGLGTMTHDLRQQLGIERQLVVPDGDWPMNPNWVNHEEFYLFKWQVERADLEAWQQVDRITTLVSIETGFGDQTFQWAKELGMNTVLIVMFEAFNPNLPAYQNVDLYICPSFKAFQEVPLDNKIYLPYPVDTVTEFPFRERTGPAKVFVHNAGSGGMNGRKGTREAIHAFMKANVPGTQLIVRCQRPLQEICGMDGMGLPANIKVDYQNRAERAELYADGDVLLYTSHLDGHALVTLEAMASGLPAIVTDAEPMNEFFTPNYPLAVKVAERKFAGTVNPHCLAYIPDVDDIAAKIRWAAEHDMGPISRANREIAERSHSWAVLRDRWKAAIFGKEAVR